MSDVVAFARDGDVAVVTLNRPRHMNAINHALRAELIECLGTFNADETVRAVVITGAGERAFCAGQDLSDAADVDPADILPWLAAQRAMYQAVRDLDKPCVAAINGVAAGAGYQIALCADWRIALPTVRVGQPELKAGLASIVGSYLMSLHVGMTHNVQLSLSADLIEAGRAYAMGLITELCEADVLGTAIQRAHALGKLPATAMRESKKRFRTLTQAGFDDACAAGFAAQTACYAQGEPQAAMRAFLDKR